MFASEVEIASWGFALLATLASGASAGVTSSSYFFLFGSAAISRGSTMPQRDAPR